MRLIPLLTAILVATLLYLYVVERDRFDAFLQGDASVALANEDPGQPETSAHRSPPTDAAAAKKTISVMAMQSEARMIDSAVRLRGQTEAARQVDIRAETSGRVVSTPLRKGASVTAGTTLCEIDPGTREAALKEAQARLTEAKARVPEAKSRIPEAQARVAEARARLEEAEINDNAANRLSADGFASETRVAATRAAVRSAEAAVSSAESGLAAARAGVESAEAGISSAEAAAAAARKEIERLSITAPFDGLLESDTAELGSLLQPGSLCATVIQLDPIKLVGFVPETDVERIDTGAPAGARLAGGRELRGEVTFVSRSADSATRTFRVEIEVPNSDLSMRDGQTTEIVIAADGAKAHLLPQSALTLNDAGALGVRLVDEADTARFAPVTILRDSNEGVWVAGLADRVSVITLGQEYVTDGVPVAPTFGRIEG